MICPRRHEKPHLRRSCRHDELHQSRQSAHNFIYRGCDVTTTGNPLAHAILRGGVDKYGTTIPNYHYEDLKRLASLYEESGLENPACVVDVNHSNSGKKFKEQIRIVSEVLHSRSYDPAIHKLVKGVMIESYLFEGAQKICPEMIHGQIHHRPLPRLGRHRKAALQHRGKSVKGVVR